MEVYNPTHMLLVLFWVSNSN